MLKQLVMKKPIQILMQQTKGDIEMLDLAMTVLTQLYVDTQASEIADALDILSAWREQTVQDEGQFGVGA